MHTTVRKVVKYEFMSTQILQEEDTS